MVGDLLDARTKKIAAQFEDGSGCFRVASDQPSPGILGHVHVTRPLPTLAR